MDQEIFPDLPDGWVWVTLDDVCEIVMGQSPPSSTYNVEGIGLPFFQGKAEFGDLYPVTVKWCSEPGKIAEAEDVLISVRAPVGPTNLAHERCCIGRGLAAIRPLEKMPSRYFLYYLRSIEQELAEKGTGSTFSAISGSVLRDQIITLAPYNEQLRIVEAIETQFTRIDEGVKLLQRLRDNLKRYKAAVLKAACEGRLVPQDPDDEPASELLKRILHERRAQWQAEGRKGKYVEPQPPDTTDLPDLPDGWVWATTNQLASTDKYSLAIGPFGSNLMVKDYRDEGIPLVFVKEIRSGIFERKGLPRITLEKAEELRSHHVHPGDLVITKMGEPPGDVAIFPDHIPLAVATSDCIKWTLSPHLRNRRYFMFAMRFPVVKSQILQITRGVAQLKMSLERFKGLNIPVPPIEEQERIVTYIDEIFSIADEVNLQITSSLQRAEHLRQSILKQAFEGRLVPQDPNDEPASVLLRHIQASRKQGRGKR